TARLDAGAQYPPGDDRELEQAPVGELRDRGERILAQTPQRVGADDVPDPGEHALVEQELGDGPVDRAGAAQVGGRVESRAEQVRAQPEGEVAAGAQLHPARPEE